MRKGEETTMIRLSGFILTDRNIVIIDQMIMSGMNFFVIFAMAKISTAYEFGVFSFFWLILLFVQQLFQATIVSSLNALYEKFSYSPCGEFFLIAIFISMISFFSNYNGLDDGR